MESVPFLSKMVYKGIRVCTSGLSPPVTSTDTRMALSGSVTFSIIKSVVSLRYEACFCAIG